jgi:hypothetical protein
MNRILLTGTALLTLLNVAVPASAAHKHAMRYKQAPVQQQWFGSGVYVEGVYRNSAAERAGLRPGDRIVGINGSPTTSILSWHEGAGARSRSRSDAAEPLSGSGPRRDTGCSGTLTRDTHLAVMMMMLPPSSSTQILSRRFRPIRRCRRSYKIRIRKCPGEWPSPPNVQKSQSAISDCSPI